MHLKQTSESTYKLGLFVESIHFLLLLLNDSVNVLYSLSSVFPLTALVVAKFEFLERKQMHIEINLNSIKNLNNLMHSNLTQKQILYRTRAYRIELNIFSPSFYTQNVTVI